MVSIPVMSSLYNPSHLKCPLSQFIHLILTWHACWLFHRQTVALELFTVTVHPRGCLTYLPDFPSLDHHTWTVHCHSSPTWCWLDIPAGFSLANPSHLNCSLSQFTYVLLAWHTCRIFPLQPVTLELCTVTVNHLVLAWHTCWTFPPQPVTPELFTVTVQWCWLDIPAGFSLARPSHLNCSLSQFTHVVLAWQAGLS